MEERRNHCGATQMENKNLQKAKKVLREDDALLQGHRKLGPTFRLLLSNAYKTYTPVGVSENPGAIWRVMGIAMKHLQDRSEIPVGTVRDRVQ